MERVILVKHGQQVPEGITAQLWHATVKPDPTAEAVAAAALELSKAMQASGCDTFTEVEVVDRPAVKVGNVNRPRAYVVRVMGWKS